MVERKSRGSKIMEYKFRGKRVDNDEWVTGSLITRNFDGQPRSYIYDCTVDETEIYEYDRDAKYPLKELFIEVLPESIEILILGKWFKYEELEMFKEMLPLLQQSFTWMLCTIVHKTRETQGDNFSDELKLAISCGEYLDKVVG